MKRIEKKQKEFVSKQLIKEILSQTVPILLERHNGSSDGLSMDFYSCKNIRELENFLGPYIAVKEYVANEKLSKEKILIVSDDKGIIRKAAAVLAMDIGNGNDVEEDDFEDEEYFEFDDEDEVEEFDQRLCVSEVDLSELVRSERGDLNPYQLKTIGVNSATNCLYYGLDSSDDREKKLQSIMRSPAEKKMIAIPTAEAESLWVRNLIRNEGYSLLELPEAKEHFYLITEVFNNFYEQVKSGKMEMTKALEMFIPSESLEKDLDVLYPKKVLDSVYQKAYMDLGEWLTEEDILWYLANRKYLEKEADSACEILKNMTGLKRAKEAAKEFSALEREKKRNPKLMDFHKNMIFFGNPGTGKTTIAKLFAKILAETGHSKEVFVMADRSSLIGRYVGQTAPKVAKKFEEARGGVLFVDEAGFFLNENSGGYVEEAMKEFIRYMEEYQDVTVIFALYASELNAFLDLDPGLSSRISRCVSFEDYTEEELYDIAKQMFLDKGYSLAVNAKTTILEYLKRRKKKEGEHYGNAREVRKLVESCIIRHAVNAAKKKYTNTICLSEIKEGITRLEEEREEKKPSFGFLKTEDKKYLHDSNTRKPIAMTI